MVGTDSSKGSRKYRVEITEEVLERRLRVVG